MRTRLPTATARPSRSTACIWRHFYRRRGVNVMAGSHCRQSGRPRSWTRGARLGTAESAAPLVAVGIQYCSSPRWLHTGPPNTRLSCERAPKPWAWCRAAAPCPPQPGPFVSFNLLLGSPLVKSQDCRSPNALILPWAPRYRATLASGAAPLVAVPAAHPCCASAPSQGFSRALRHLLPLTPGQPAKQPRKGRRPGERCATRCRDQHDAGPAVQMGSAPRHLLLLLPAPVMDARSEVAHRGERSATRCRCRSHVFVAPVAPLRSAQHLDKLRRAPVQQQPRRGAA